MKFECPSCKKSGQVDDSKVPENGVYATCPQCNNKFLVKREAPNDFTFESYISAEKTVPEPQKIQNNPRQEPNQKDKSLTRRQIYQAAVGKNADYYLPIFEKFDKDGKPSASWNWAAFFGNWMWCGYRRMIGISSVFFITGLILTMIGNLDKTGTIVLPLFVINILVMVGLGMYANSFYYNHINKRMSELRLSGDSIAIIHRLEQHFKPNRIFIYIAPVFIGIAIIGIIAAVAIPQFYSSKNKAVHGNTEQFRPEMPKQQSDANINKPDVTVWTQTSDYTSTSHYIDYGSISKSGQNTITLNHKTFIKYNSSVMISTFEVDCSTDMLKVIAHYEVTDNGILRPDTIPSEYLEYRPYNDFQGLTDACSIAQNL